MRLGKFNCLRCTTSLFESLPLSKILKFSKSKNIFIAGTDTNVGKTIVSAWLCLHSKCEYFKPIASGLPGEESDTCLVQRISDVRTHNELYSFHHPLSPHLAARIVNTEINLEKIKFPNTNGNILLVEGPGGLLVPLNSKDLVIDLIKYLQIPVVLVSSSKLGTINHTLLSLEALKRRSIHVLGVIVKGVINQDNCDAIEHFGNVKVIAQVPYFEHITKESLLKFPLTPPLQQIFCYQD